MNFFISLLVTAVLWTSPPRSIEITNEKIYNKLLKIEVTLERIEDKLDEEPVGHYRYIDDLRW